MSERVRLAIYNNVTRHLMNLWLLGRWTIEGRPTAVRPKLGRITQDQMEWAKGAITRLHRHDPHVELEEKP